MSSLSRFLGTHKAAMKWKNSLLLSEYFTKKMTHDPGTFDVDYNDTPAARELIKKSQEIFYAEEDEYSFMNEPPNSYELSPVKRFKVSEVKEIIKGVMHEVKNIKNRYEASDGDLCKSLADEIKRRVKNYGFSRYKILCVVSLLPSCERQNIMIASRCLWNTDFDTFAQETFEMKDFTVVATVYALYYE